MNELYIAFDYIKHKIRTPLYKNVMCDVVKLNRSFIILTPQSQNNKSVEFLLAASNGLDYSALNHTLK